MTELTVNLALAGLLLLTAFWCALVHRRLRRLRTERGEMEAFIAALAGASERAEAAILGLREAAAEADRRLREQGDAARQRSTELARLLESGSRLARRLEGNLDQGARTLAGSGPGRERLELRPRRTDSPERSSLEPAGAVPRSGRGADGAVPEELLRALETLR